MNRPKSLDPALMARAASIVRNRTGLAFHGARQSAFEASVGRSLQRTGGAPAEYVERLAVDSRLLDELVIDVTVGETYFFRDDGQFALIRERLLPDLVASRQGQPIRVWSAGCATGEEAYSLAIAMREAGATGRLIATDISRKALAAARRAMYRDWSLRGVADPVVRRYFRRVRGQNELDPDIRNAVDFQYFNLASPSATWHSRGFGDMDLVLCRNVLIYFDATMVKRVAARLVDALSADGWLLTGASDPPLQDIAPCEVVTIDGLRAYRRRSGRAPVTAREAAVKVSPKQMPSHPVEPSSVLASTKRPKPARAARSKSVRRQRVGAPTVAATPASGDELAALYEAHRFAAAASLARQRVDRNTGDVAAWIILVRTQANTGQLKLADATCMAALEYHPLNAELEYLHGVLIMHAGRTVEAAEAFRRAIYLDRTFVLAHLSLAQLLSLSAKTDAARRAFMNAEHLLVAMDPDAPVLAGDGETAGHLLAMTRAQAALSHAP